MQYATKTAIYYHRQPYNHIEHNATFCHISKHVQSYDIFIQPYIYIYNHNNVTYIPHYTTIANDVRQNGAIYNIQRY